MIVDDRELKRSYQDLGAVLTVRELRCFRNETNNGIQSCENQPRI
jgi:hypothetical protein